MKPREINEQDLLRQIEDLQQQVTDLKTTLSESEDKFRRLTDSAPVGIYFNDAQGKAVYINNKCSELVGVPADNALTFDWIPFLHPDDRDRMVCEWENAFKNSTEFHCEYRWVHQDGSIVWTLGQVIPILGEDGKATMFIGSLTDITERKQAEQSLLHERNLFMDLLNTQPAGIYRVHVFAPENWKKDAWLSSQNTPYTVELVTDVFCNILGVTRETFENTPGILNDLIYPDDKEEFAKKNEEAAAHLEKFTWEGRLLIDGVIRWINFQSLPRPLENGDVIWTGALSDITERKQAEKESSELESQLHQAQKIKSLGQLAGGIAHDFNNILAGLYGNVSLAKAKLIKSLPDHPGYRYLEAAEKSMNRATTLTNQLLTFSKGGVPLKKTFNLSPLIEEVVSFNLSGSNVKPIISKPDNLWLVFIDQGQIQQVFGNLTINAKQAMPGGGELQITLENAEISDNQLRDLDAGKYIRITFSDNGTGIAPELLERVFEPYFTTKQTGSGLGLATVYSIIKKHGGHISITSKSDQGTTFTLYLPVAKDQILPPVPTVNVVAPLSLAARVLVMDDEEMFCDIVKTMLEDAGHTVETVDDGKLALDHYRQALETNNPFDLVILDLTIPGGMGGKEVVKQILALYPLAKVIVSSGYADDPLMAHYADYGFKAVVPKPFELGVLIDTVNKVLMGD